MQTDADIAWIEREGPLFDRVAAAIEQLRPALQADGGDVTLREIEDRAIAIVEFAGKCEGCPLSQMTVKQGIELHLRSEVPEILTVDVWSDPDAPERGFRDIVESARIVDDPAAADGDG